MPRQARDEDEEPVVESEEDEIDDEEGSVGPEDPTLRLDGELDPPYQTTYAAKHLFEMLKDGDIDVNPEYQRDVVWAEKAQADVIESYIKNFHVPPLLLKKTEDGKFVCMDGKQRLTSIKKFFSGELPIRSSEGKNLWYKINERNNHRGGNLLPVLYRKKMEKVQISVNEYRSLDPDDEREMFQRVQYGMALNAAEKLFALPGVWPDYIRGLYKDTPEKFWDQLHLTKGRMARFYALVRLGWYLSQCGLPSPESIPNPGFPGEPALRRWMESAGSPERSEATSKPGQAITYPTEEFKDYVSKTLNTMKRIVNTKTYREVAFVSVNELPIAKSKQKTTKQSKKRKGRNTLSPVEFVCIGIFISRNLDLHLGTISRGIRDFRNLVQSNFPREKKWNSRLIVFFWNWIENNLFEDRDEEQEEEGEDQDKETEGEGDDEEEEDPPATPPPRTNGRVSTTASRRSNKVGPPSRSAKKVTTTPAESPRKKRKVLVSSGGE